MLDTSAQGLTMTIPPALTMLPETGRVTVTVPWPLLVVLVLAPPACTIWAPAKLAAGIVIIPANTDHHHHFQIENLLEPMFRKSTKQKQKSKCRQKLSLPCCKTVPSALTGW